MEVEQNNQLPFLYVQVKKRAYRSIGHIVYRKATHLSLLVNADDQKEEMTKLQTALLGNGFSE